MIRMVKNISILLFSRLSLLISLPSVYKGPNGPLYTEGILTYVHVFSVNVLYLSFSSLTFKESPIQPQIFLLSREIFTDHKPDPKVKFLPLHKD